MLSDREIRERLGPLPASDAAEELTRSRSAKNRGRRVQAALVAAALAVWAATLALFLHLRRTAPHRPDPQFGEIYRFSAFHTVLYLTAHQQSLIVAAAIVLPLLTIFAVFVAAMPAGLRQAAFGSGE